MIALSTILEFSEEPDRELDYEMDRILFGETTPDPDCPHYTQSVDIVIGSLPTGWLLHHLGQRDGRWHCTLRTTNYDAVTWGRDSNWITDVKSGREVKSKGLYASHAICSALALALGF